MECDIGTKTVKVFNIEGDPGPMGPVGPAGPVFNIPIYTSLAAMPVDGSILLALYRPEYGINIGNNETLDQWLFQFCGGDFSDPDIVIFTDSEKVETSNHPLPAGWKRVV